MRALYISIFVFLLTLSLGVVAELNQLYMAEKGVPLIPASDTGNQYRIYQDTDMAAVFNNYSISSVPPTGNNYFLASNPSWTTNWALIDTFLWATIGFGSFMKILLPSLPQSICDMIGSVVFINNLLLALSFLRGFWLSWRG